MTNKKIVIGVAGMPGAGKATIRRIVKKMGCSVVVMGDVIRQEAKRRRLQPTPENLGMVMLKLREEKGPTVVADRCIPRIENSEKDVVVIDGIRSPHEVNEFRRHFPNFILIAIHASPETRFQRLFQRQRSDDPKGWDAFLERDMRELSVGLGDAVVTADYTIVNEGTRIEFERKAHEVLGDVLAKWTR